MIVVKQQTEAPEQSAPDITSELIRIIFSSVPLTLTAILVNSLILAYVQWGVVAHEVIMSWLAIVNGLSIIRLALLLKFRKLDATRPVPVIWSRITLITSMVSGMIWGSLAFWFMPESSASHQAFTAFVLAGMCAGAVTTLSAVLSSSIVFVLLSMLPLIGALINVDTSISLSMAVMAVLFTVMILMTSRKLNRIIKQSLYIRHERILAEETIRYQAYYDSLTDLPNRRLITERIQQEMDRSVRNGHIAAVMFLDLDHFKSINDSLGHAVGDELLRQVARRLKNRMRNVDTTARLGGDEFIILISKAGEDLIDATENIDRIADQVLKLFAKAYDVSGNDIHLTASVGIALFPFENESPDQLMHRSDMAMYQAKKAGRNTVKMFLPEMNQAIEHRRQIERELNNALDKGEFELYYQPQVSIENRVEEVEALLRWNHPRKGVLNPTDFLDVAERNGAVIDIGRWVLGAACRQLSELQDDTNIKMCINISPRQFKDALFVDTVKKIVAGTGVDPARLRFEITEIMIQDDIDEIIEKINILKSIGISFSLDDFGSGDMSLVLLKQLPVDIVKIDSSLTCNATDNEDSRRLIKAVLLLSDVLQLTVVAEGVETVTTLNLLKSIGCANYQGDYFCHAMSASDLHAYMKRKLPPELF